MSETLALTIYRPAGKPKGAVTVVHGMSEHRRRYDAFAEHLQNEGYGVITYDLPGHGETAGEKRLGYFGPENGMDLLVSSVQAVMELLRREFPDVPVFLFGHSMGTIISRCWLQKHGDVSGVVLSGAPNYTPAIPAGLAAAKAVRLVKGPEGYSTMLDELVTGQFNKALADPKTPVDWISYDTGNVERYLADPLCGFPFTVQGYVDLVTGLERMHDPKRYGHVRADLPIVFFAGKDDPCTGGTAGLADSIATLQEAGYGDVSCRIYDGMRHEILNEAEHEKVFADISGWLDEHI